MFCNSYLILLTTSTNSGASESGEFDVVTEGTLASDAIPSLVTLWRIMLGDVDMTWFESNHGVNAYSQALFLLYTVIVVIILLNVAIAVVSDSYDRAMMESQQIFQNNRLERAAMLKASATTNKLALRFAANCIKPFLEPLLIVYIPALGVQNDHANEIILSRALEQEKRTRAVVTEQGQALSTEMNQKFDKVDQKQNEIEAKIEAKVGGIEAKVDGIEAKMDKIMALLVAKPALPPLPRAASSSAEGMARVCDSSERGAAEGIAPPASCAYDA